VAYTESALPVPARKPAQDTPVKAPASGKKPVIVIDAGHGGVDPGALGANGVYEKQVTLNMARALKEELEKTGRYKVLLTRNKDAYLKLYKRVEFARANHADLFISLHADSIGKSNVRGASIYTLSEKASDEQTALLADRENRADLIAGMDLNTSDEQVATILVDLTMRDTMNQSKFFANKLVGHMEDGSIQMLDNPHRFAGFAVLKAPDIPSVLIEMGFMSNPREAEQMNKPEYRRTLARSLIKGIDGYFAKLQQMQRS
jgi:N-acetylmuramoyl-L-alanine amidase